LRILKTLSLAFGLNLLDYALGPVTTVIVAKCLSVGDFGFYSWMATLSGFILSFCSLGLGVYNYKTIPGRPIDEQYFILGRSLFIELICSLVGILVVAFWIRDDLLKYGVLFLFVSRVMIGVVNAESLRFLGYQKRQNTKTLIGFVDSKLWAIPLLVFFFLKTVSILTIVLSLLIGNTVTLVLLLISINSKALLGAIRFDSKFARTALAISLPLLLIDVGLYFQEMLGRYLLKGFTSYESLGLFSFTYGWFAVIFKFGILGVYIIQPHFSEGYFLWKSGKIEALDKVNSQLSVSFKYSIFLIVGAVLWFIMEYQELILLVGKKQYSETFLCACYLSIYPLAIFVAYFNQILLVLQGKTARMPLFYLVALIVNVLVTLLLIRSIGYAAAGIASSVSYVLLAIIMAAQNMRSEFKFLPDIIGWLKFLASIAVFILCTYLLKRVVDIFAVRAACMLLVGLVACIINYDKKDIGVLRTI